MSALRHLAFRQTRRAWTIQGLGLLLAVLVLVGHAAALQRAQGPNIFRAQRTTPDKDVLVIFTTAKPDTAIWLLQDGKYKPLANTDAHGQLRFRLPPGPHLVMTKREGYEDGAPKSINVSKQGPPLTIDVPMGLQKASPTPTPTPPPTPTPTPTPPMTLTGLEVMNDFLDPKKASQLLDPKKPSQLRETAWVSLAKATFLKLAGEPNNKQLNAQAQFARGQAYFVKANYQEAEKAFRAALAFEPDYAPAHYGLGDLYLAANNYALAGQAFELAVKANPKLAQAWHRLGDVRRFQKKDKEAQRAYTEASRLGYLPPDTDTSILRAEKYIKDEKWEDAKAVLKEPAEGAKPPLKVLLLLGDAYAGQGDPITASEKYTSATTLYPESAIAFYKLGELRLRTGKSEANYQAALEALREAERLAEKEQDAELQKKAKTLGDKAGEKLKELRDKLKGRIKSPRVP